MIKCHKLGQSVMKADKALKKGPNDKERKRAEHMREEYESMHAFCKQEIDNADGVFLHHKCCLEVMLSLQVV